MIGFRIGDLALQSLLARGDALEANFSAWNHFWRRSWRRSDARQRVGRCGGIAVGRPPCSIAAERGDAPCRKRPARNRAKASKATS